MQEHNFHKFIIFWLSQSISQLGSAMTGFALIIWAYGRTGSALTVSLMTFCSYLPYILVSLFAGAFVDQHDLRHIMMYTDLAAATGSFCILLLWQRGSLEIRHIYLLNIVIGFMNSLQSPAESVSIGLLVPEDKLVAAGGMDSFSGNLITVVSPMLAASLVSFGGLGQVIAVDLATFLFAYAVLLFFITIPKLSHTAEGRKQRSGIFAGIREGFAFLNAHSGLWCLIGTMAAVNFFSRLTYENILSPMILARSSGDGTALGLVNGVLGIGGILGGIAAACQKKERNPVRSICLFTFISFLFGDLLMGPGRGPVVWYIAGFAASFPVPYVMAGQRLILYRTVPSDIQGRVFAVRTAIQYSTIPAGILLGGLLADLVFEPFMAGGSHLAVWLSGLVGTGSGSGMALMFLCTGLCGSTACLLACHLKGLKELKQQWEQ